MIPNRKGDWLATNSGRKYWPMDPRPEDITIEDIAHHLSMICRFGGALDRFYSVAEHSVLCSMQVPVELALEGLLHDAPEAYLGDMVRPIKHFSDLGAEFRAVEIENRLALAERFGLQVTEPLAVKEVDTRLLFTEARDLGHRLNSDEWAGRVRPYGWHIGPQTMPPDAAEGWFLERYKAIGGRYA